jgi:hypothetical protein
MVANKNLYTHTRLAYQMSNLNLQNVKYHALTRVVKKVPGT